MKVADIRKLFLEYFAEQGHSIVESASLVPSNDPSLLFTNAGMVQFKDLFLGLEKRDYTRAASCQKCVRAGGKHNDLENVGFTARHHTFFEMLGNFSFGDYFKKEAISMAWDFVTNHLKLPKEKLYVTVYKDDDEAFDLWSKGQGVDVSRILRLGEKDNFWSMGDTGPCGPCSEIFIDRGEVYGCGDDCGIGRCECDRYMEFWNLVFMQFNRDSSGKMTPLPKPSVDTGMGLERIAAILQNVDTNYEIDSFRSILDYTGKLANKAYDPKAADSFTYRVIADHARASAFLIADGVLPANEGRGYVLRRIIRRAIRYGKNLGFDGPFLNKVCQFVVDQMSEAYPNLSAQKAFVARAVEAEEEQFFKTLERGLNLLDEEIESIGAGKKLSGNVAFRLYDTYGFPLDLTTIICRERSIEVDEQGFVEAMKVQKQQSRKNWKGSGDDAVANIYHDVQTFLADESLQTSFEGYEQLSLSSKVLAMIKTSDGQSVMLETFSSSESETLELVFEKTCFYPEGGGQAGDKGTITCQKTGFKAQVLDVIKPVPDLIVVQVKVLNGSISVGDICLQETDSLHRAYSARNHTATHMLHWALRDTLGEHVKQAGSLVNSELLRFDFTHFQALTVEELQLVEDKVNQRIFAPSSVNASEMHKKQALASGAIAFFGEKYADTVRVVKVGDFSVELCGGTHVASTAEINLFKIVSEASVASGVRRIVAYTSKAAFDYLAIKARDGQSLQDTLKAHSFSEAQTKLEKLIQSEKDLRKEIDHIRSKSLMSDLNQMIASAKTVHGVRLLCYECPGDSKGVKTLRELADNIRQKAPDVLVVLGMKQPETQKVMLLVAKGSEVSGAVKAGDVVSKLAPKIEGRGGGKPDMAQAGGTKLDGLKDAFASVETVVSEILA